MNGAKEFSEYYMFVGSYIKKKREEKAMFQKDVANALGKSRAWLCDIERGRRAILFEDMASLSNIIEFSIDECVKECSKMKNKLDEIFEDSE